MTTLPNVGTATVRQWLTSMDVFEKLQPKRIVPSHGPMGDTGLITASKTMLRTVQSRTIELKKQGKTLDETTATISAELQQAYPTAGTRLSSAIRAAYSETP
jgi:hypothetical protein